ncbi:MAG: hypothetical protein ACRCYS_19690, partial [Beijerinckiaceae bacterium]
MAIGTLTAIGLGLGAVGAIASSGAQKSAANTAANAATQTSENNNALARDIYGQNKGALSPYMQRGNVAGDYLNAMLGIPSTTINTGQQGQPASNAMANYASQAQYGPAIAETYGNDFAWSPNMLGGSGNVGGPIGGYGGGTWNVNGSQATPGVTSQN